uniref:EamA domain-containing protein n=1 Tax=Prevotella sp. GTC17254 TaxID=3236794 RepID=A0AB33IWV3_9BACT
MIKYIGEIISIGVAFSWTIAALSSEVGSKRLGIFVMNVWRMSLALLFSILLCWILLGTPFPVYADTQAWIWLLLSGAVGYFFGDWCLYNSYLTIGSRYGQLFMTLAPMFAALAAWVALGQVLSWGSLLAMTVTMAGIAISILGRSQNKRGLSIDLPTKGILYGIGAGMGQGVGLVLSKIGLDHYTANVPSDVLPQIEVFLPFSANLIRCIAGLTLFSTWLLLRGEGERFKQSMHNGKGMLAMLIAVLSGPFIGVGFSLLAVQYTAAGIASTLMAISPIMILLPTYYMFHQPITLRVVLGAVISVIGVSLFFI